MIFIDGQYIIYNYTIIFTDILFLLCQPHAPMRLYPLMPKTMPAKTWVRLRMRKIACFHYYGNGNMDGVSRSTQRFIALLILLR